MWVSLRLTCVQFRIQMWNMAVGQPWSKYIYLRDQGVSCLEKNNHIRDLKCTCLAQRQCPSIRVRGNFGHSSKGPMVTCILYTTLLFCFFISSFYPEYVCLWSSSKASLYIVYKVSYKSTICYLQLRNNTPKINGWIVFPKLAIFKFKL